MSGAPKFTGKRKFDPSTILAEQAKRSKPDSEIALGCAVTKAIAEQAKRSKPDSETAFECAVTEASAKVAEAVTTAAHLPNGFRYALYQYIRPPNNTSSNVICRTDQYSLVIDAYPKAAVHLLLIPTESFLNVRVVQDLRLEHYSEVKIFHEFGRKIVSEIECIDEQGECDDDDRVVPFRCLDGLQKLLDGKRLRQGYHSIPSLYPLHLHIISDDFYSPCMKKREHWNKFTTPFFVPPDTVEKIIQDGTPWPNEAALEAYLWTPLTCHRCNKQQFRNFPQLKQHVFECNKHT